MHWIAICPKGILEPSRPVGRPTRAHSQDRASHRLDTVFGSVWAEAERAGPVSQLKEFTMTIRDDTFRVLGLMLLCTAMVVGCASGARPPAPGASAGAAKGPANDPKYVWESPNGWKGGSFRLPPKDFAPDLGFRGREVLRFSPGYFKGGAHDAWTYAFVLMVDDVEQLPPEKLERELHTYFLGLGRNLGKKRQSDLASDQIAVKHVESVPVAGSNPRTQHTFRATVFDSWSTQAPVDINLKVDVWLCKGNRHQAIFVSASPLPYTDGVWQSLAFERDSFRCGA